MRSRARGWGCRLILDVRLLPACLALEKKEDPDKEIRGWAGRGRLLMGCVMDVDGRDFL